VRPPRRRHRFTAAAALLLLASSSAAWAGTRQHRRSSRPDEEAEAVVSASGGLAAPSALPPGNRVQPPEATVSRLVATLTMYKPEADSDYHLVLSDGAGNTMIADVPDPACAGAAGPLLSGIEKARAEFDAHDAAPGSFRTAPVPVTVTGVGFFDFLPGQSGVASNGIELHAVLDVEFGPGGGAPPNARFRKRIAVSASS
jgi:hypothetical protein